MVYTNINIWERADWPLTVFQKLSCHYFDMSVGSARVDLLFIEPT